jgi:hypothetical protein
MPNVKIYDVRELGTRCAEYGVGSDAEHDVAERAMQLLTQNMVSRSVVEAQCTGCFFVVSGMSAKLDT